MHEALTLDNLTEPREKVYFALALIFAIGGWLACLLLISPIMIIGFMALFAWLGNGLLVAQLKADAVKVDADQMPALADTFAKVCAKLGMDQIPELYVLQSGGLLNAFATRHCGRDFVVLFSELLETYGPDSTEVEFLLGHELGHIRNRHIVKRILLAPGLLFPLLGSAYGRACEMTCDRHGAFAATNMQGAVNAMMVLAGGKQAQTLMRPEAFAAQYTKQRGFFVSWYELISGYPTLSQRLANLLALQEGRTLSRASRNPLAYPFAMFTIGGTASGGANLLITVAIVGLLAAIAIPSFVKARETAQLHACVNNLRMVDTAKEHVAAVRSYEDGTSVLREDLSPYIPQGFSGLRCTQGGDYSINSIGKEPACSVHGSLLASRLGGRSRLSGGE